MAHGDAREDKWKGKMRMEWVARSLALDDGARSIQVLSADPHSSTASSRLNWHPRRFKWTRPFRWKTKSGFCACVITFRTCYTLCRAAHPSVQWKGGTVIRIANLGRGCEWLYSEPSLFKLGQINSAPFENALIGPQRHPECFSKE